jgi:flagellar motor switch protein FliG
MSNESDQRIRHVAIVLQSLDAATSRGLLAQLPPGQSKQVKQAMVNLGRVSPQERTLAFQSMQGLIGAIGGTKKASPEPPAAALLAAQSQANSDQIEWSEAGKAAADAAFSESGLGENGAGSQANSSFNNIRNHTWQHIPIETFADILHDERPIVIATVINQLPVERATEIVQLLPIEVAGATLAALPHLHMTDAAILRDIEQEIERKIGQHQPQVQASSEGMSRLQAILAGMPDSQKSIWFNAVARSNPVLGSRLDWTAIAPSPMMPQANPAPEAATSQTASQTSNAPATPPKGSYEDVFEEPILLPITGKSKSSNLDRKQPTSAKSEVGTSSASPETPNKTSNSVPMGAVEILAPLMKLSDRDFVTVLHACSSQTVLLALSGATKSFVARVERLIPPKDVSRLRAKLNSIGPIQLQEVDAAQAAIVETATRMFDQGKIGALDIATYTAAA